MTTVLEEKEPPAAGEDGSPRLVRNYLTLFASNALAIGFSLVTTLLLTRVLGPEGYGRWSMFLSAVTAAVILGTNWTLVGLVRIGCEELVRDGTIARAFWARTALAAASLVVVGAVLWGLWLGGNPVARRFAVGGAGWTAAAVVSAALSLHVQYAFQAAKRMGTAGVAQVLERAVLCAGTAVAAWFGALTFDALAAAFVAGGGVSAASLVRLAARLWLPPRTDRRTVTDLVTFSAPYVILYACGFFGTSYLDVLILAQFVPAEDVGVYFLAGQMSGLVFQATTIGCTVMIPALTTAYVLRGEAAVVRYLTRTLPYLWFGWAVVVAGVAATGPYLIPVVFGDKFDAAVRPFYVLLIGCSFGGAAQLGYAPVMNVCKLTWLNTATAVAAGVVNVGGNLILIPRYGIVGCAAATVLSQLTSAVLFAVFTTRTLRTGGYPLSLLATAAPVLTVVAVVVAWREPVWGVVAAGVAAAAVARLYGLFGPADRAVMAAAVRHRFSPTTPSPPADPR